MSVGATTKLDLREVNKSLRRVSRQGKNLAGVFRRLEDKLKADQRENFKRQEGPGGKWPGPAPSTLQKRLQAGKRRASKRGRKPPKRAPKKALGQLRTAFDVMSSRDGMAAFSLVDKFAGGSAGAEIHQSGGAAGKGARIPARTFHWVSPEFLAILSERIAQALKRAF